MVHRGNRMEYEIKWQHYRSSENTWEPLSHHPNAFPDVPDHTITIE